ncbi:MAG: diacylglycerol kinase family lipid kinase [Bacteroidia bacterium]
MTLSAWYFIVNPQSGGGKCARKWPKIEQILQRMGIDFSVAFTREQGDAIELVKAAVEKGYRRFVAVGGDGTVNEAANGILSQEVVASDQIMLASIPIGSGNDWARMYGLPKNYQRAVQLLQNPQTFLQDAGKITWTNASVPKVRYFNNIAGFLFETFLTEKTLSINKSGFTGQFVYLISLLKYMFQFQASAVTVRGDDFLEQKKLLLVTVGIGRYNGGGMNLVPLSLPDDGLLDITIADDVSAGEILRNILKIYNGKIYTHPKIRHFRSRTLWFEGPPELKIEADGEVLDSVPVKIEILPRALRVVVPLSYQVSQTS